MNSNDKNITPSIRFTPDGKTEVFGNSKWAYLLDKRCNFDMFPRNEEHSLLNKIIEKNSENGDKSVNFDEQEEE